MADGDGKRGRLSLKGRKNELLSAVVLAVASAMAFGPTFMSVSSRTPGHATVCGHDALGWRIFYDGNKNMSEAAPLFRVKGAPCGGGPNSV